MSKKTAILPTSEFDVAARNRLLTPSSFIVQNFVAHPTEGFGSLTQLILSYPGRPNICDQLYPEDRERPAAYAARLKEKIDDTLKSTSAALAKSNTAYIPFTSDVMNGGISYQAYLTPASVRFVTVQRDGTFSVFPAALTSGMGTKDTNVIKSFRAGLAHQTDVHDWIEFLTDKGETVTCQKSQIVDILTGKNNKLEIHFDGGNPAHDAVFSFSVNDASQLAARLKESLGLESPHSSNREFAPA